MILKIKNFIESKKGREITLGLLLITSMIVSFILGRMSKEQKNAIILEGEKIKDFSINPEEYNIKNVSEKASELSKKGNIVASKIGSKYYFIWCSGAKNLSEKNKIYFQSEESAQKAGYSLATNCKNK